MNIKDLPQLMAQLEGGAQLIEEFKTRAKETQAFEALFSEIGAVLSDLLEHMEKSGPEKAKALADALAAALKGMRPEITLNAAPVHVEVSPTPVQVNLPEMRPVINVQAPQAPEHKGACDIQVYDVQYDGLGRFTSMRIKKS